MSDDSNQPPPDTGQTAVRMYTSRGTIRVRLDCTGYDSSEQSAVFLTPDTDHSGSRDGGVQYALFFPDAEGEDCVGAPLPESGKGVPLSVPSNVPNLVSAAIQRTLVEVGVVRDDDGSWRLLAITIPAPDRKK